MTPISLPDNRLKWRTTLPAKFEPTLPARHMITTLILLDPPPTKSVRTPLPNLLRHLLVRALLHVFLLEKLFR